MAIAPNRFFNNPGIAQAAANLSSLFSPVGAEGGADAANFALADERRAKMNNLGRLFDAAQDPAFDQTVFDRMGQATGQWNPANGYYGVNVGAETLRANNAADNARALAERQMIEDATTYRLGVPDVNERYKIDTEASVNGSNNLRDNQVKALTSLYGPLDPGQVRPEVAEDVMSIIEMPGIGAASGAPKPLSETEVKGGFLQALPPEDQRSVALSDVPIEQILYPDDPSRVVNVPRDRSYGQQAYINKGAEAKPVNYQAPDGTRGTAATGPNGALVDTQTGQPVPAGSVTFGTNIQGSESDTGMSTKTNLTRAVQIRGSVTNMNGLVSELETLIRENPAVTGAAGNILSFAQDAKQVLNEFGQKFGGDPNMPVSVDDVRNLTNSLLPETGPYNPVYRKAAALVFELAYANAKINNPSGEVSRFALERELEQLGQGLTGNDEALKAVLDVSKSRMRRALTEAEVLSGASAGVSADQIGGAPAPAASGLTADDLKYLEQP